MAKVREPVSYGYQKIPLRVARRLSRAWLDKTLPISQWQIVEPIIKARRVPAVAMAAVEIIKRLGLKKPAILDMGCSSGYYHDFLKWAGVQHKYSGCDLSPDFITLAQRKHLLIDFCVAPITKLPYRDNSFDIVLASGVLHYELNYRWAFRELVRVSSKYVLLHRLPVFSTTNRAGLAYYKKIGYGIEMMEVIFDQTTLRKLFLKSGLEMKQFLTGDQLDIKKAAHWCTILLEKMLREELIVQPPRDKDLPETS